MSEFLINWNLANDGDTLFVEASTDGVNWELPLNFTFGGASGGWQWMDGQRPVATLDNLPALYLRWRLLTQRVRDLGRRRTSTTSSFAAGETATPPAASGTQFASGTSMASPHVAGAAALAFAKVPERPSPA